MLGAETNVAAIANSLKAIREEHQRITLFLGSRVGVLYSNDNLYKALVHSIVTTKNVSKLLKPLEASNKDLPRLLETQLQVLENLSAPERFKECYSILKSFNEIGIHSTLTNALAPICYREEDELLAGIIKGGFFDSIITTNIDTLLEDSCETFWSMHMPDDYQVFRLGIDNYECIEQGEARYGKIFKVFGDWSYLRYEIAGNKFGLSKEDKKTNNVLDHKLSKEVLIIGYDSLWDKSMEKAFIEEGKRVWYVNEEDLPQDAHLAHVLERREGKYLVGAGGSYSSFVRALYDGLVDSKGREIEATPLLSHSQYQQQTKKKVFISYSHQDSQYFNRFKKNLDKYPNLLDDKSVFDIKYDINEKEEKDWKKEIKKALHDIQIAILLISADFFASDFIRKYELPALLEAAQAGEIALLPVILGPCVFARTPLYQYQPVNSIFQPLIEMVPYEQDMIWAKLVEIIHENITLKN